MKVFLAVFFLIFARSVAAEGIVVKSGSHDGFVRLVVEMPDGKKPVIVHKTRRLIEVRFPKETLFNVDHVFDYISNERLDSISQDKGAINLRLNCDCELSTHIFNRSHFVIDIQDGANDVSVSSSGNFLKIKNFWKFDTSKLPEIYTFNKSEERHESKAMPDSTSTPTQNVCPSTSIVKNITNLPIDFSYGDLLISRTNLSEKVGNELSDQDVTEFIAKYLALGLFAEAESLMNSLNLEDTREARAVLNVSDDPNSSGYDFSNYEKCHEAYVFWSIFSDPPSQTSADYKSGLRMMDSFPEVTRHWIEPHFKERLLHLGEVGLVDEFWPEEETPQLDMNLNTADLGAISKESLVEVPISLLDQLTVVAQNMDELEELTKIKLSKRLSENDVLSSIKIVDEVELSYDTKLSMFESIVSYAVEYGGEGDILLLSSAAFWQKINEEDQGQDEFTRLRAAIDAIGLPEFDPKFSIPKSYPEMSETLTDSKQSSSLSTTEAPLGTDYSKFLEVVNEVDDLLDSVVVSEGRIAPLDNKLREQTALTQ
ncbi:MAG: hypothetical protein VXZ18_00210 [Pseudomonadota bacterium]|nr:hypothetical protein [Pseudomonadota bacterium]